MLSGIKGAIKKNYYDPNFHGIDIEARFERAAQRLKEVDTTGQGLAVIAQVLMDFNDSHLYFLPPLTNLDVEYGWRLRMYGDKCFVITVKPGTDAEKKGLKVGDQVLAIEGYPPSRKDLWKMNYYYDVFSKRKNLTLRVLSPGSDDPRDLQMEAQVFKNRGALAGGRLSKLYYNDGEDRPNLFATVGGTTIWKMRTFELEPDEIDMLMDRFRKSSGLILDLRGNGGGYVKTLERLAGFMFDKELTIAELKGLKKMDPQRSSPKEKPFRGKLIVLTDSVSASAAEIFARLVQIENRGVVVGDVSAGAVMQSIGFNGSTADDSVVYGASITNADVIMSDGKSLEHVGVTPNELVFPTAEDLANGRDPVLSKAIQMLGGSASPEDAGKFFRYQWKNDQLRIVANSPTNSGH